MANITADMVKQLRERTGAGMMDCKKVLIETNGDMEKAAEELRKKGLASAAKKGDRQATEGAVQAYIHLGGRIGVLVEINCETDFVANNEMFKELTKDIAMHIAAAAPQYVARADVPADVVAKEKAILTEITINEGKPAAAAEKIVEGRLNKYFSQICLLEQTFVKNDKLTIEQLINEKIATIGEKISIRRFVRYAVGEGMEKKVENLADVVQAEIDKRK